MKAPLPASGPARLDYYVAERLALLRMTRAELSRRGGPDRSTLRKAHAGERLMSTATLTRLDDTLGWAPGSSAAILNGGQPACTHHQDRHTRVVLDTVEDLVTDCHTLLTDVRTLLAELRPPEAGHHAS